MREILKKNGKPWQPVEMAVCMGFDAFRIATGQPPKHFSIVEVLRWLHLAAARVSDEHAVREDREAG